MSPAVPPGPLVQNECCPHRDRAKNPRGDATPNTSGKQQEEIANEKRYRYPFFANCRSLFAD